MERKELAIILEILYKDAGMKSAGIALEKLERTGKKTEKSLNQVAMGMGGFKGRVDALYSSLQKATPKNLHYAKTFDVIKQGLARGQITIEQAKTAIGDLRNEMGMAEQPTNQLSGAIQNLVTKAALMAAAGKAIKEGWEFLKESTLIAARVETLGVVTDTLGKNAGYTSDEVRKLEEGIQSMGITTQASRQALAQMLRAEIDLAAGTDLARLAQDAAVIANENSSQSFQALTYIIGTGNTYMARRRGLLVDFVGAYQDLAQELGKTTSELTQQEKIVARTNEVLDQGRTIAGAYAAAMETAGKKLTSLPRYVEEYQRVIGEDFTAAFGWAIDLYTDFLKSATDSAVALDKLTEAHERGIITLQQRNILEKEIRNNQIEGAEVLEGLAKLEEIQERAVADTVKTYAEYLDIWKEVIPIIEEYGWVVQGMTEAEWDHQKAMEAEAAKLATLLDLTGKITSKRLQASIATAAAARADEEYFLGTLKAQKISREVASAYAYQANKAEYLAEKQRKLGEAMAATWGDMQRYADFFDEGRWAARTGVLDTATETIMAQLEALHKLEMPTAKQAEQIELWTTALEEMNPAQAKAMETSLLFAEYIDLLNDAYARGKISAEEYADGFRLLGTEITGFGVPIDEITRLLEGLELSPKRLAKALETVKEKLDEGIAPATILRDVFTELKIPAEDIDKAVRKLVGALKSGQDPLGALNEFMEDLKDKTQDVADTAPKIGEAVRAAMAPDMAEVYGEAGLLDEVADDIDTITDKADDPVLEIEDQATPVIDSVWDYLEDITSRTWEIEVDVDYGGFNPQIGGGGGPGVEFMQRAMSRPVFGSVPAGHEDHSYRLGLRSGEDYAVWNRNQAPPQMGNTTIEIPVTIGQISSDIDVDDLLNQIGQRVEETRR